MKRKLFIGSSSEGMSIATQLKEKINSTCGDWLEAVTWKDGGIFPLNKSALDSLIAASRKYDYGVLIASKDDIRKSRKQTSAVPRDNVVFEMGMFLGSLGLTRAFLLVEDKSKLPTDYNGITVPVFNKRKSGSLDGAMNQIIEAINSTKLSYNLKPVPSAALALGYFENFVQPLAKKRLEQSIDFKLEIYLPQAINDVRTEIIAYKKSNASKDISIFDDGARPRVNELLSAPHNYWDIPSTLSTLHNLINLVIPSAEIGDNPEKNNWISHELRNFKGTIEILVQNCKACNGNVSISYLP